MVSQRNRWWLHRVAFAMNLVEEEEDGVMGEAEGGIWKNDGDDTKEGVSRYK